jgi:hypothetical protein
MAAAAAGVKKSQRLEPTDFLSLTARLKPHPDTNQNRRQQ